MWLLAFKNIICRKGQSILTAIIAMLAIFIFVVVFSVFQVMQQGINLSENRLGADVMVLPDKAKASTYETLFTALPENVYMNKEIVDKISNVKGIEDISPEFFTQTLEGDCCSFGEEIRVVGYDSKTDFMLKPWFNKQKFNNLKDNEIVIGSEVGGRLGNKMGILGDSFNIAGTLYPTGSGMDYTIYLNIDVARKLALKIDKIQGLWSDNLPKDLISVIYIKVEKNTNPKKIVNRINDLNLGVRAFSTSETIQNLKVQIDTMGKVILGLCIAVLIISALSLIGRFDSLARERKKEIGMLRAIGVQKSGIFKLILIEATLISSVSGIIGSFLGVICVNPILEFLKDSLMLPSGVWSISLAIICMLTGIIVAILLGIVSCIYPAFKSASLQPQEAISQGEVG